MERTLSLHEGHSATEIDHTHGVVARNKGITRSPFTRDMLGCSCTLRMQLSVAADLPGWLALGFSSNGSMVGSDAVVGYPQQATAVEYDLQAKVSKKPAIHFYH